MNNIKRDHIIRKYCLPEADLREAYSTLFNRPEARVVLMDLIIMMSAFERSGRTVQGASAEYSVGFGDGKKAAIFRILEYSGHEDRFLRAIDPEFECELENTKGTK